RGDRGRGAHAARQQERPSRAPITARDGKRRTIPDAPGSCCRRVARTIAHTAHSDGAHMKGHATRRHVPVITAAIVATAAVVTVVATNERTPTPSAAAELALAVPQVPAQSATIRWLPERVVE